MSEQPVIEEFISDVKWILDEDGPNDAGLERIRQRMSELTKNPNAINAADAEPAGNIHTGRQSRPLYMDDSGLTLVRARFGPEAMTPIHNHGSWGVIGVYRGRDRYQIWQRVDEGNGPGEARVEMVEERVLEPGEAVVLPHPPQDIHAQQGHDGEATYEFVLFGSGAAMTQPRLYFDPQEHSAREVMPGQR